MEESTEVVETGIQQQFSIDTTNHETNNHSNSRTRNHERRRHHERRRQRHRRNTSRSLRYEKSLVQFSSAHIILGILCVILQMVNFYNKSILSQSQPGLWTGSFFVITGSVCLGLARTKGLTSTLAMLSFCLVSLFLALTLTSLSWFGAQAANYCQTYYEDYCYKNHNQSNNNHTEEFLSNVNWIVLTESVSVLNDTAGAGSEATDKNCADIQNGYCGYDIGLARTIHSLLVLTGVVGSTTSFVLSTLACSRPGREDTTERRRRMSSIFAISGHTDQTPNGNRPITPWEFPPPIKEPILADSGFQFPDDEPPPPYTEQDNMEFQCRL